MKIKVVHQIMEWNEDVSNEIKEDLKEKKVCLVNVMGSPGAGKTSLITSLVNELKDKYRFGVIEGDHSRADRCRKDGEDGDSCSTAEYGWRMSHRSHVNTAYTAGF